MSTHLTSYSVPFNQPGDDGADWIYVGELPDSITSPSNSDDESKAKLDLTLEMLSLAHFWVVTGLHERLQEFIINAPDFINPYWVKDSESYDFKVCLMPIEVRSIRACKARRSEGAFESLRRIQGEEPGYY